MYVVYRCAWAKEMVFPAKKERKVTVGIGDP